jgi:hypothetical protein
MLSCSSHLNKLTSCFFKESLKVVIPETRSTMVFSIFKIPRPAPILRVLKPVEGTDPTEILKLIKQDMIALCAPHLQYRATGISLMGLRSGMQDRMQARTLFDIDVRKDDSGDNGNGGDNDIGEKNDTHTNVDYVNATVAGSDSGSRVRTGMDSGSNSISSTVAGSAMRAVLQHVDTLNQRFGEHAVMLGSSLHAVKTQVKYRAPTYRTHHTQPSYTPPFSSDRTWEIPLVGTVKAL